jgi:hypothetical protein
MKNTKFYVDPLDDYLDSLPAWVHYAMGVIAFGVIYVMLFIVFSL